MTDHSERSLSHTAHSRDGEATVLVGADACSTRSSASSPIPQGSTLGRFVVIEEIGAGGMGRVLRAYDPKLHREVALELMHTADEKATERMLREAQAMAQLGRDRDRALQLATQARDGLEASAPGDPLNAEVGTWLVRTNATR